MKNKPENDIGALPGRLMETFNCDRPVNVRLLSPWPTLLALLLVNNRVWVLGRLGRGPVI